MKPQVSELALQRWIDGELDEQAATELVVQLDQSPEQWRDVALALLEQRHLDRHLPAILSEQKPLVQPTKPIQRGPRQGKLVLAITLSMLLGLSLGALWRGHKEKSVANRASASSASNQSSQGTRTKQKNDSQIAGRAGDRQTPGVQLVSQKGNEMLPLVGPTIEEDLELQLFRHGFLVERETNVMEVKDASGQDLSLPVDRVKIRYLGESVFQ